MDRAAALDELPEVHAVALRLHDAGHNNTTIATALGIEIESVALLLDVAEAKLARLATPLQAVSDMESPGNAPSQGRGEQL
jgi:DNA-directed RNA polymerase specialized sigma24 family protein